MFLVPVKRLGIYLCDNEYRHWKMWFDVYPGIGKLRVVYPAVNYSNAFVLE